MNRGLIALVGGLAVTAAAPAAAEPTTLPSTRLRVELNGWWVVGAEHGADVLRSVGGDVRVVRQPGDCATAWARTVEEAGPLTPVELAWLPRGWEAFTWGSDQFGACHTADGYAIGVIANATEPVTDWAADNPLVNLLDGLGWASEAAPDAPVRLPGTGLEVTLPPWLAVDSGSADEQHDVLAAGPAQARVRFEVYVERLLCDLLAARRAPGTLGEPTRTAEGWTRWTIAETAREVACIEAPPQAILVIMPTAAELAAAGDDGTGAPAVLALLTPPPSTPSVDAPSDGAWFPGVAAPFTTAPWGHAELMHFPFEFALGAATHPDAQGASHTGWAMRFATTIETVRGRRLVAGVRGELGWDSLTWTSYDVGAHVDLAVVRNLRIGVLGGRDRVGAAGAEPVTGARDAPGGWYGGVGARFATYGDGFGVDVGGAFAWRTGDGDEWRLDGAWLRPHHRLFGARAEYRRTGDAGAFLVGLLVLL